MKTVQRFISWLRQPVHGAVIIVALLPIYSVTLLIYTYGLDVPTDDQWFEPIDLAVSVKDGTFRLSDITREYSGHRPVFMNLVVVALTYLTDWYVPGELFVTFVLALLRLLMLVLIFRDFFPHFSHIGIVAFSFLIFSPYQGISWLSGIYSVWHFVSLFALAAVWVLLHFPVRWRTLAAGAVLAACATFSQGSGIVVFPVLAITLWMFGYRKWSYYLFWFLAAGVTLYLYLSGSSVAIGGTTTTERTAITFNNLPTFLRFILAFQGNTFSYRLSVNFSFVLGIAGIALLCANLTYLWLQNREWRMLAPWLTMAGYSGSTAIIIFLTRYRNFMNNAVVPRYAIVSTQLWVAVVATSILVYVQWRTTKSRWAHRLLVIQGAVGLVLVALYLPANIGVFQTTAIDFGYPMRHHFVPPEDCVRNFALYRQTECLETPPLRKSSDDDIYKLAYYGLGIFRDEKPMNLLPRSHQMDDPLLLHTPTRWMGVYLNRWYLGDIPEDRVLYIAPPPTEVTAKVRNLPHILDNAQDSGAVLDFVGEAETIWYVYTRETNPAELNESLMEYVSTPVVVADYRYGSEVMVIRYDRKPDQLAEAYRFGGEFSMQGFSLLSDYTIQPCGEVRLKSWWINIRATDAPISATLVVVGENGAVIGQLDEGLAFNLPTPFWETGKLYVDERLLKIDCDAPPGKYDLLFGMYMPNPVQDLEVTLSDGTSVGSRAYLTTIFVEEQN